MSKELMFSLPREDDDQLFYVNPVHFAFSLYFG